MRVTHAGVQKYEVAWSLRLSEPGEVARVGNRNENSQTSLV